MELLRAALDAGEDEQARSILEHLKAQALADEDAQGWIESFERLLTGRELARQVRARLASGPVLDDPSLRQQARVRLWLEIEHSLQEELTLSSLAGRVGQTLEIIDRAGSFQVDAHNQPFLPLERVRVPPGMTAEIEVGVFEQPLHSALAVQSYFRMVLPGIQLELGEQSYSVRALEVSSLRTEHVTALFPLQRIDARPLLEYLQQPNVHMPALVERLVRIDPALRAAALEELLDQALGVDRVVFAARYAPALRWLSGERDLGAEQEAWRAWKALRVERQNDPRGALELPESADGSGIDPMLTGAKERGP